MSSERLVRVFGGYMIGLLLLASSSNALSQNSSIPDDKAIGLAVQLRSREKPSNGDGEYKETLRTSQWNPKQTAIIVCDMWNDHTCKGAAARVAEMAPAVNRTIKAARERGVFIVHAPSGTMSVYEDTIQRRRAIEAPFAKAAVEIKWNNWDLGLEGEPFTTIVHGGCGCPDPCPLFVEDEDGVRRWKGKQVPWTRQIETIEIHRDDAISDNGQESFNMIQQRGINNVILMGVHTNICVSGRPFGLRQMAYHGKNVVLCRDLTDALLQSRVAGIDQFRGTDLIVEHIETHICPTITSASITGEAPFRFRGRGRE